MGQAREQRQGPEFTETSQAALSEAISSVAEAAGVTYGLWFSYIFVLLYLLIAAAGVTHRDLLLQSLVKLPFLNIDLPLIGFFVLGPAFVLIVHAYVLLHLLILSGKVDRFHAELHSEISDDEVRERLRRQLPSNIFVQLLAGPREVRTGLVGWLLRSISLVSLVVGPVALLVFFQVQFLPYHDEMVTWWHRLVVVFDLGLLWALWPSITRRGALTRLTWADLRSLKLGAAALGTVLVVSLVLTIATFPGEWLENTLPTVGLFPRWDAGLHRWRRASLHELLFAGDIDERTNKPTSLWSNRLILLGFDIDQAKQNRQNNTAMLGETISLRMRHLEGAVLVGANLRGADFTAARLQGAKLAEADLRDTIFTCAKTLETGDLSNVLDCTQLQEANLSGSRLQGAVLAGAHLQGSSLFEAGLQGGDLFAAKLDGASMMYAHLEGANLILAKMQGASLFEAHLEGALLRKAQLQGVDLRGASLQGTDLEDAHLEGADLFDARLWRARGSFFYKPMNMTKYDIAKKPWDGTEAHDFVEWRNDISQKVPEKLRKDAIKQLSVLDPTQGDPTDMQEGWAKIERPDNGEINHFLFNLVCSSQSARYVARRLMEAHKIGNFNNELAAAMSETASCPGVHNFTRTDWATLDRARRLSAEVNVCVEWFCRD
jgi:uncharacterized protein YjbI with pentapeptide repeats